VTESRIFLLFPLKKCKKAHKSPNFAVPESWAEGLTIRRVSWFGRE
jgi:hypothetical protein